jgi:hypothetical protein
MTDAYWYPSNSRLADLQRDLSALSQQVLRSSVLASGEFVPLILKAILRSASVKGFPTHQIDRWVWVALQYHSSKELGPETADAVRGSLAFLTRHLAKDALTKAEVKDITWTLDYATNSLKKHPGLHQELFTDEVAKVLLELENSECPESFDAEAVERSLAERTDELKGLSASPNFETIAEKLRALLQLESSKRSAGGLAQKYLLAISEGNSRAKEIDRPLGIMRDVHIIEAAYSAVTGLTPQLPLLKELQTRWPFVSALPILGTPPRPLGRYAQYIAYICLYALFHRSTSLLVLRSSGAHTIIAATIAAVEAMLRETEFTSLDVSKWKKNQAITISDGTKIFRANYIGTLQLNGKRKFWLGVRDSGAITVHEAILPFIATAPEPHKTLSLGNDIQTWLRDRHPDPLIFLTGSSRRRLMRQDGILLLAPKNKFDEYITSLHPLGASPAALLGLTYVSSNFEFEHLTGTTIDTPRIYVCSDGNVAADLIREPPEHVGSWRVIVDGARNGTDLLAAFPLLDGSNAKSICIVGELHEREACSEIVDRNTFALFLDQPHVEIPGRPLDLSVLPHDAASKSLASQSNHSRVSINFHPVNDAFLEDLSLIIKNRSRKSDEGRTETTSLDLQLSDFLKKAISRPIGSEPMKKALNLAAQRILEQASMDRQYDDGAEKVYVLFSSYLKSNGGSFDRSDTLRRIIENTGTTESIAILCRSERIADECYSALPPDSVLRNAEWLGIQRLRKSAPRARVIVGGWLDRFSMRELSNSGYGSSLDFVLLPFERDWLSSTLEANSRFEKRLNARGRKLFADLAADLKIAISPAAEPVVDTTTKDLLDGSDVTDIEKVEERALDSLLRSVAQPRAGQTTANAQLVIFEEAGSYAYLPPTGKVIVLPGHEANLDEGKLEAGLAEQLLFQSVSDLVPGMVLALPVETDRDLVDARADMFLKDAARVRSSAAIWKDAIRRHIANDPIGHKRFAEKLTDAGRSRQASTVRSWILHSATVAPSNYRQLIPLIAKLTNDPQLQSSCNEVMQSVDQIYRAKSHAAAAIVRELFSGVIDKEQDELVFDLNGHQVIYQLRHVKSLAGVRKVPVELIGKSARIAGSDQTAAGLPRSHGANVSVGAETPDSTTDTFPIAPIAIVLHSPSEFEIFKTEPAERAEAAKITYGSETALTNVTKAPLSSEAETVSPIPTTLSSPVELEPRKAASAGQAEIVDAALASEPRLTNVTKDPLSNRIKNQINFEAFASLRKWPSLGGKPLSNSTPYLLMDDTLERCIAKFMSQPSKQQHLYEIHTSPQPPLVSAVMLADNVVELDRLLETEIQQMPRERL